MSLTSHAAKLGSRAASVAIDSGSAWRPAVYGLNIEDKVTAAGTISSRPGEIRAGATRLFTNQGAAGIHAALRVAALSLRLTFQWSDNLCLLVTRRVETGMFRFSMSSIIRVSEENFAKKAVFCL
jgi:hypothetical protein